MRRTMFRWPASAAVPLAVAGLALLLATCAAQARDDSDDSDSSAPSSNTSTDSDRDRDDDSKDSDNDRRDNDRSSEGQSGSSSGMHHQAALGVVLYPNTLEIRRVLPGSPAAKAGLQRGDDILSVNGQRVNSTAQLQSAVRNAGDDERIKIGVLRGGEHETLRAKLASREEVFGDRDFRDEQYGSRNAGRNRRQNFSRNPQAYDYDQGQYQDGYGQNDYQMNLDNRGYARRGGGYYEPEYGNQGYGPSFENQNQAYYGPGYGSQGYYGGQAYGQPGYGGGNQRYEPNYGNAPPGYRERDDRFAQYRRNRRGALGVTLDEDSRGPVRINHVYRNGPAEEAGLRPGDEIVAIDGREIRSTEDLLRVLANKHPGEQIRLAIDRNGRERTIRATLESPNDVFAMEEQERGYRMTRSPNRRSDREDDLDGNSDNNHRGRGRDDESED